MTRGISSTRLTYDPNRQTLRHWSRFEDLFIAKKRWARPLSDHPTRFQSPEWESADPSLSTNLKSTTCAVAAESPKPLLFVNRQCQYCDQTTKRSTTSRENESYYMQTAAEDKIQQRPKRDNLKQEPILVPPGGGDQLNIAGSQIFHKIKSKNTGGVFSVVELVTPRGKGLDLHVHEREDELVYLLEGEIEVTLGNQKMKVVPGVMALLPRGIPHGFTNIGNKPSRLLDTILPGHFDNYFIELAALFATGEPSEKQIDGLSRKYAIKYLSDN